MKKEIFNFQKTKTKESLLSTICIHHLMLNQLLDFKKIFLDNQSHIDKILINTTLWYFMFGVFVSELATKNP
jgi:hypothetical protein